MSKLDSQGFGLKYMGTNKPGYHLTSAQHHQIVKDILKTNLAPDQYFDLITSLYALNSSTTEVLLAGTFLNHYRRYLPFDPILLDSWLNHTHGWCEVDTLCQSNFTADELLNNWGVWQKLLVKFSFDQNVHKRRASLVLLVKSVRQLSDPRLSQLAFLNIDRLKSEKDILITKAVSWLLRSLISHHKDEVSIFLEKNSTILPKIAIREVRSKLATGKKYVNLNHKPKTAS